MPHYPVSFLLLFKRCVYISSSFFPQIVCSIILNAEKETRFSWAHVMLMFALTQVTMRWATRRRSLGYTLSDTKCRVARLMRTARHGCLEGSPPLSASGDGLHSQLPDFCIPAMPLISSVTVNKFCASLFLSKKWRHECTYLWLRWLNLLITQAFRILPDS